MGLSRLVVGCGLVGSLDSGCAELTAGTVQELRLSVSPSDANVTVYRLNGEKLVGPTQLSEGPLQIPRPVGGIPYLFVFSRAGYCPAYRIGRVISSEGPYAIEAYSVRASLAKDEPCPEP